MRALYDLRPAYLILATKHPLSAPPGRWHARAMTSTTPQRAPYSYRRDPAMPAFPDDHPIIIFDGLCALCSGWARFVLRNDRAARYRLLCAQSPLGGALYRHYGLNPHDFETNILIEDGVAYFKSEGCIRMFEGLGRPWPLVRVVRILPLALRDAGYALIARNRLRWFGTRATCFVPAPGVESRFLK